MRRNPERLAWTILTLSLIICLGLAVTVPLLIRSLINDTFETALITLEVQQGTALVSRTGQGEPIGVTTQIGNLPAGTSIRADENVQALLTIRTADDRAALAAVQIFGSTSLTIEQARSPRFDQSTQPHRVWLIIDGGRARLSLPDEADRPGDYTIETPQAVTELAGGSYAFEVTNDETQITVREGHADVSGGGSVLALGPSQRTVVKLGGRPAGILSPERNLIVNGNFRLPLEGTWDVTHDLQQPTEAQGTVTIETVNGRPAAVFERQGTYHAETALRQIVDRDVRDFQSLKLHFVLQIVSQDVPVCGQAGSECPMMVKLDYKDDTGTDRSFLQGFYWLLDPNGVNPTYNTTSGTRNDHVQVPRNFSFTYETDNLMETLRPTQITAITFYASGHSWRAAVSEIELLGEQ